MPAKNKIKKKQTKAKKVAATKVTVKKAVVTVKKAVQKKAVKKKAVTKKAVTKKTVKKETVNKKAAKTKVSVHKPTRVKTIPPPRKKVRVKNQKEEKTFPFSRPGAGSAGQSGDLQGLSRVEGADSESVAELLEEGNTFEAEVVAGVEAADDDEMEVHTHEVPEDDVPEEYLDED